jgi:hypothetical protein
LLDSVAVLFIASRGPFMRQRYLSALLCFLLLIAEGGCVTASLATLGTVLGFAGTAASTGAEVYNLGKLDFSVMATNDDCRRAVVAAAADLQLHVTRDEKASKDTWEFDLEDDVKGRIGVRIQRRAARLCQCRVDVGWFGSEPTAKLVMERIRRHLPSPTGNCRCSSEMVPK